MKIFIFWAMFILVLPGKHTLFAMDDVNHAQILKKLNSITLEKGRKIYLSSCMACHGADGTASLPQARSFSKDPMRFGAKPYDMWKTITNGSGSMPAQSWLTPEERYYVVQYIRETFFKRKNPTQYMPLSATYLASLPKPKISPAQQQLITRNEALKGSLQYGQHWFSGSASDYGMAIHSQLKDYGSSLLTVHLRDSIFISYNLLRLGTAAVWKGALDVEDTKYKKYRGEGVPKVKGEIMKELSLWQWTYNRQITTLNHNTGARAPLSPEHLTYYGYYKNGERTIIKYAIEGRDVLEMPGIINKNGNIILAQTLHIAPGQQQSIYIGQLANAVLTEKEGVITLKNPAGKKFLSAAIVGDHKKFRYEVDEERRLVLTVPASEVPLSFQVLRTAGSSPQLRTAFESYIKTKRNNGFPDVTSFIKGGPAVWKKKISVSGKLNVGRPHFDPVYSSDSDRTIAAKAVALPKDYPYAVDNIPLPFNNPWNAWIRPSCLSFKKNGNLVIATYTGDVWVASGVNATLENITWQRVASGLYEPMGLKIINDDIYVTCRNGIMLLQDLNQDGETDFYNLVYADPDVSSFFHAFNFGLETDSEGNFYYNKAGQYTDNKDPGNVMKISKDGKRSECIAMGFRTPNGITVTPGDQVFASDNQGNWIPANKISHVRKGGFYGYVPNLVSTAKGGEWGPDGKRPATEELVNGALADSEVNVPKSFDQPALWMPQELDNSPGGGAWSDKSWGPLGDHFIHSSFGRGWLYTFYPQYIGNVTQGAMLALPFQFEAGIQRVAINPADRQVYTTGLTGWDDGVATQYGILSRVRYKGGEGHMVTGIKVVSGGIQVDFSCALDETTTADTSSYNLLQYNYRWTKNYGSDLYSVLNPGVTGKDTLHVSRARVLPGGQSLLLEVPQIGPANTLRLRFKVKAKDGAVIQDVAYLTIHTVPE